MAHSILRFHLKNVQSLASSRTIYTTMVARKRNTRNENSDTINILVINCGSSSIKFQIVEPRKADIKLAGIVERIGEASSKLKYKFYHKGTLVEKNEKRIILGTEKNNKDKSYLYNQAFKQISNLVGEREETFSAIGHRVVHGGENFSMPVRINDQVKQEIKRLGDLAPLHNPTNLLGIEVMERIYPNALQTAVFDTSFHQTIPEKAFRYAIPDEYYKKYGLRRYGFHGTSHYFVINEAANILDKPLNEINVVSCHLGNGCSVAASRRGKCIDTSMGFSPLEGLVMGRRSGDIDPTVIQFIANKEDMSLEEVMAILNNECGFKGIAGVPDSRDIELNSENGDIRSKLAIDMFCYRLAKYIASYVIVPMNGKVDALVFTGGIGENSYIKRGETLDLLKPLGFTCDQEKNKTNGKKSNGIISESGMYPAVIVIPTNEELIIAMETLKLLCSTNESD